MSQPFIIIWTSMTSTWHFFSHEHSYLHSEFELNFTLNMNIWPIVSSSISGSYIGIKHFFKTKHIFSLNCSENLNFVNSLTVMPSSGSKKTQKISSRTWDANLNWIPLMVPEINGYQTNAPTIISRLIYTFYCRKFGYQLCVYQKRFTEKDNVVLAGIS